ncbi:MAG: polysaccharide biosynthesis tyrosine autokinase [Gemmatimonadaceae bacterium]|nr:polysaccharide biosynthesis tyrosine autokinase [Gemmatimonadaceae bacterium]
MTPDPANASFDEPVDVASTETRDEPPTGFSPREVLAVARRRWILILTVFAVVTAIGAWRTMRQPRIYQATATVRFQQPTPAVQGIAQPQIRSFTIDPLQSEQLLIRSQSVAERAANKAGLRLHIVRPQHSRVAVFGDSIPLVDSSARGGEYSLDFHQDGYALRSGGTQLGSAPYGTRLVAGGLSLFVPQRPDFKESSVVLAVSSIGAAADEVRGGTTTRVIPQTDVIEITYRGTDPGAVRDVANSLASAYAQFSSELQTTSARNKTQFIENALANQKEGLAGAQGRLQAFKETHQVSDVSAEATALFTNIHELEGLRQDALVDRSVYEQLLGKLTQADTVDDDLRKLAGTEAITKNTYVANLYNRWFDLLKTREEIMATGKNSNDRDVQATEKLIARTKRDLQEASRVYLDGLQSRLASYDKSIAQSRRDAERFPPLESEQARLTADVRTTQTAYDNLLAQLQLARIAESADGPTVRVVDAAELPTFAVAPIRKRALAISMALGLILGIGLALGLEKLDDSVKLPDELPQRFNLAVLGQIPSIRANDKQINPNVPLSRLVSHVDPRSVVAEAYRSLRTNIAFARAQSRARTLVLTSPGPADGKSTTVANLAITFAQQGQRTLLIDGDLRRAVLDKTFSVPRTPGLTELIVGVSPLADAVHETSVENLFVMGSGQLPPNPSELLGSERMREVIAEARESFDVILFDSPPLLAVTDAAVLSTMVDGAILVVRMGTTSREAVRRAAAHLRAVHSRVLGAVLNDIDVTTGGYYGGYGYYYYAYQSHEGDRDGRATPTTRDRVRKLMGLGHGDRG